MKVPSFADIYRGVPPEDVAALLAYRESHPDRTFTSGGLTWRYQVDGDGPTALLFLAGGVQYGESWFRYLLHFKERFRCLAPTYPDTVAWMKDVIEALERMLEMEGVQRLAIFGTSLGGLVGQMLVRRLAPRVSSAVLANTSHPDPSWARRLQRRLPLMQLIPTGLVRFLAQQRLHRYSQAREHPAKTFYDAYMIEHSLYFTTRTWVANHYRLIIDFCLSQAYTPEDLAAWPGKMLLVESEDDLFPEGTRQEMRRLYPMARVYRFGAGAGHSPAVTREAEYLQLLESFLFGA